MSKKLLFNEGGDKVPVLNKYTGTDSNYPIEVTSELLDEEEKTYIEEIEGNTWQRTSVGKNIFDKDAFYEDWKAKQSDYIYKEEYEGEELIRVKDGGNLWEKENGFVIAVGQGRTYTLSLYVKSYIPDTTTNTAILIRNGNNQIQIGDDADDEFNNWAYRAISFTAQENYIYICSGNNNGNYYWIKNMQIEEGTIATEYEPYMPIDLTDIRSVGDTPLDEVYEIEIAQATCPYEFGKGGRL